MGVTAPPPLARGVGAAGGVQQRPAGACGAPAAPPGGGAGPEHPQ